MSPRRFPLLLVLLPTGLVLAGAHPAAPQWTVVESAGTVSLSALGRSLPLAPGATLATDAAVVTGRDGHVVLARGGDRVTMSGNARLRVAGEADLVADRGKANFAFASSASGYALVTTPFLLARAQDTHFSITVTGGGASVQPESGAVDVSTLDGTAKRRLQPGMVALVGADQMDQLIIDGAARGIVRPRAPVLSAVSRSDGGGAVEIAALP